MMWGGKYDSHFRRHLHHIILITSIMLLSQDYQDVGCDSDDVRMWDGEPEKSENEERRLVAVLAFVNLIASPFRRHHHYPTIHYHRVSCIQTHWQADEKIVFYWTCKHWNCGYHTFVESSPNSRNCFSHWVYLSPVGLWECSGAQQVSCVM